MRLRYLAAEEKEVTEEVTSETSCDSLLIIRERLGMQLHFFSLLGCKIGKGSTRGN